MDLVQRKLRPLIILPGHSLMLLLNRLFVAFHRIIDSYIDRHNRPIRLTPMLLLPFYDVLLCPSFEFLIQIRHFPKSFDEETEQNVEKPYSISFFVLRANLFYPNWKYLFL